VLSCQNGYSGPYCAIPPSTMSSVEFKLLVALSTAISVAVVVLVVLASVYIYKRLKNQTNDADESDNNDDDPTSVRSVSHCCIAISCKSLH